MTADRYLTVAEAAAYLNTSERFVRRLIAERRIAFHKVGAHVRIAEADLEAFVQAGRVEPITVATSVVSCAGWRDGEQVRATAASATCASCRSGRWQASYPGRTGAALGAGDVRRGRGTPSAGSRLPRRVMIAGGVDRPGAGRVTAAATTPSNGSRERPALRPRTVELYRWLLGKHITPQLGAVELGDLATPMIREWRADLLRRASREIDGGEGIPAAAGGPQHRGRRGRDHRRGTRAGSGAPTGRTPRERPVLTVAQVFAAGGRDAVPAYRVLDPGHRVRHAALGRGDRAAPLRRRTGRELGPGQRSRTPRWSAGGSSSGRPSPGPACARSPFRRRSAPTSSSTWRPYVDRGPDALRVHRSEGRRAAAGATSTT